MSENRQSGATPHDDSGPPTVKRRMGCGIFKLLLVLGMFYFAVFLLVLPSLQDVKLAAVANSCA